jgi:hypothetical protein
MEMVRRRLRRGGLFSMPLLILFARGLFGRWMGTGLRAGKEVGSCLSK